MNSVLISFLDGLLRAAVIWAGLLIIAVVALIGVLGRPKREKKMPEELRIRGAMLKRVRLTAQADELERFASQVTVAAERAAVAASRRRTEWLTAQGLVEFAWEAYEAGDAQARRLLAAAALPTPHTPSTPAEYAARERFLHRAAMDACSHRQLSALDLSDALAHRNGWDPKRHPVEQEVVLRRFVRDGLRSTYQAAAQRERAAWLAANTAAVAARSLREEAFLAAERARVARRTVRPSRATSRPLHRPQWSVQATVGMRLVARPSR